MTHLCTCSVLFLLCRFENKLSELLIWIKTYKTSLQALAATPPETTPHTPDLQEKLKVKMQHNKQTNVTFVESVWVEHLLFSNHSRAWSRTSQERKPQLVKWSRRDGSWWTSWREVRRKRVISFCRNLPFDYVSTAALFIYMCKMLAPFSFFQC